jgi:phosphoenolpyruvate-protein phosphotransferase
MLEQPVNVINRLGLHARAAAILVRAASEFVSVLRLARADGSGQTDAKSILDVLMLSASRGTELRLIAEGPDEAEAVAKLAQLFADGFGEEDSVAARARRRGPRPQRLWRGLGVSEGVVTGRVLRIFQGAPQVFRVSVPDTETDREVHRLRAAVRLARRQLLAIKNRARVELGEQHAYIFDSHLLMVGDHKLLEDVENFIRRERVNAEWAVKVTADRILALYAEMDDNYLRERGADVEDVLNRLLNILSGERPAPRNLQQPAVIVAEDLPPSALAELDLTHVRALILDAGGWTSHTAIIARSLGIPAIVGARDLHQRARTGDLIAVDAAEGLVYLHPTPEVLQKYEAQAAPTAFAGHAQANQEPLFTADNVEIIIRANLELPAEYAGVKKFGARGVGLFRSEFLVMQKPAMPDEEEQYAAYAQLAELSGADGATIRLFDLGGDKIGGGVTETERNPALGLRAIRLSLTREGILRVQARAILRAAARGRLRLVLPMISDVADIRLARAVIEDERQRLESQGLAQGPVEIGAMIEVPAAVATAHHLARVVDFFSLGTNDLIQYTLAADRGNEAVAAWFRTLHPAVLQSVARVLAAARAAGIPAGVCGEMAATPVYSVILLGLGATELSMMPAAIPRARQTLSQIKAADAQAVARELLDLASADEVENVVAREFSRRWPQLFSARNLPRPAGLKSS